MQAKAPSAYSIMVAANKVLDMVGFDLSIISHIDMYLTRKCFW